MLISNHQAFYLYVKPSSEKLSLRRGLGSRSFTICHTIWWNW